MSRRVSEHTTRHYWYPGERAEWVRAGAAVGLALLAFVGIGVLAGSVLAGSVSGAGVLAAVVGVNLGRRDARALAVFPDLGAPGTRVAIAHFVHIGRAAWRAMLGSAGAAAVAVLVARLPPAGWAADWVFPMVPAAIGALAHRAGMLYERLRFASPSVGVAVAAAAASRGPVSAAPGPVSAAAPLALPVRGAAVREALSVREAAVREALPVREAAVLAPEVALLAPKVAALLAREPAVPAPEIVPSVSKPKPIMSASDRPACSA